ncbi:hypothetical protein LMG33818_001493 [Halomonadaceae bacterium LMG 33818]|uniref:hypothetical protein n=1 Tax=Cernens ardua TaxID=3402176 RepID=UPI003EDC1012
MPLAHSNRPAKIRNNTTNEITEIDYDSITWSEDKEEVSDSRMGGKVNYHGEYDLDTDSTMTWFITEYPTGIKEYDETFTPDGYNLIQDLDLEITSE